MADMSFDVVCVGAGNKNLAFGCWATKYGGLSVAMFDERYEAGAGYLAAEAVCEDLGLKKWWSEPKMVTEAREKGLL